MVLRAITLITATISSLLCYAVLLDLFMPMLVVVMGLLPAAVCRLFNLSMQCGSVVRMMS